MDTFDGRRVLVTGASGLVGRAIVPVFRSVGHDLVTCDLRGPETSTHRRVDLTDAGRVSALIDDGAGFDVVVHAAAIPSRGTIHRTRCSATT